MSEGSTRKNVSVKDFAKIVHNSKSIDEIVSASGLKRTTVSTKLNSLRKLVGKENVPSYKSGGKKKSDPAEVLAILQGK